MWWQKMSFPRKRLYEHLAHVCELISPFHVKIWLMHLYMLITLYSYCYTATCFIPQGPTHREYWYILWAGSTKHMSRCKCLEVKTYLHVNYADYKICCIKGVYTWASKTTVMLQCDNCHITYNMLLCNLVCITNIHHTINS